MMSREEMMLTYSTTHRNYPLLDGGDVRSGCNVGGEWCYRGPEKDKKLSWKRFDHLSLIAWGPRKL